MRLHQEFESVRHTWSMTPTTVVSLVGLVDSTPASTSVMFCFGGGTGFKRYVACEMMSGLMSS